MNGALLAAAARNRDITMSMRMPESNQVRFRLIIKDADDDTTCIDNYTRALENFVKRDHIVGPSANIKTQARQIIGDEDPDFIVLVDVNRSAAGLVTSFLKTNHYATGNSGRKFLVNSSVKTTPTQGSATRFAVYEISPRDYNQSLSRRAQPTSNFMYALKNMMPRIVHINHDRPHPFKTYVEVMESQIPAFEKLMPHCEYYNQISVHRVS